MKRLITLTLAVGIAATALVLAQAPRSIESQFKAAQHAEEVEGDLKKAIGQYRQIAQTRDRTVAVRALIRLAECHQKLGDAEARNIYERIVREYSDHKDALYVAVERLGRMKTTMPPANLTTRQLWTGDDMSYVSPISSDGRSITFQDADTGDLAIRNLDTGEKRRLTNKGSWSESASAATTSVLSRDGRQVAYVWFDRQDNTYDLRLMAVDEPFGTRPRILYASRPEIRYVSPFDWSPDGKRLLTIVTNKDNTHQIAIVGVPNGSLQVIKSLDWQYPWRPSFSPDGKFIAYNLQTHRDSRQRDVFVLAADGSTEATVSDHPADDYLLGWAPRGDSIVFASDRTGATAVWNIGVTNGKSFGLPELIMKNIGDISPMGISQKGSLYHHVRGGNGDLYTVDLDNTTFKPLGTATTVTERFAGNNSGASWSRDGRYLAYVSQRGLRGQVAPIICIRSNDDGRERELLPSLVYVDGYQGVRWGPGDGYLIVAGQGSNGRAGLYTIDVKSGSAMPLALEPAENEGLARAELSPDAKTLFYRRSQLGSKESHIVARDIGSGDEREITRVPHGTWPHVALSPDGKQLAFGYTDREAKETHLAVVSITDGRIRQLAASNSRVAGLNAQKHWAIYPPAALLWTPDGQRIIIGAPDGALWLISAYGAERQFLGIPAKNLLNARMHPGGHQIAFNAGSRPPEIWVVENLPGSLATR